MWTNSGPRPVSRARGGVVGVVLAIALLLGACSSDEVNVQGIQRPQPLDVSSVTLTEVSQDGSEAPFTFRADPGHLLVAYFGYTHCPDLCPTTLSDVSVALDDLGDQASRIDVAFTTVDPDRDTASVIVPYLRSFIPDGHAIRSADTAALASAKAPFNADWNVIDDPDGDIEVEHTSVTYVIDAQGLVIDEWTFGTTSAVMASDLKALLKQQPQEERAT